MPEYLKHEALSAAPSVAGLVETWRARSIDKGFEHYAQWAFLKCANELQAATTRLHAEIDEMPMDAKVAEALHYAIHRLGAAMTAGGWHPPSDNDVVDFIVAYHGYPDRATALRVAPETIFDEAKLIQSWATLTEKK